MGYKYANTKEHGKLLVRAEPVASILTEALMGYASGRFSSQVEVKHFLERHEAFPKGINGEVHFQRVADILTRSVYAGRITLPKWASTLIRKDPLLLTKTDPPFDLLYWYLIAVVTYH